MDVPFMNIRALNTVRPDPHTQRVAWNKSWEDDLATLNRLYYSKNILVNNNRRGLKFSAAMLPPDFRKYHASLSQPTLMGIEDYTKAIVQVQERIVLYALPKLAHDNLEGHWTQMADDRRKEVILEGIYRTFCALKDLTEWERRWCPEITIPNISANQGKFFLDSLKRIISDRRQGDQLQPVDFPNSGVEEIWEGPKDLGMKLEARECLLSRCYYMSYVIYSILLAVYKDESPYPMGKMKRQAVASKYQYASAAKVMGKDLAHLWTSFLKNEGVELKTGVHVCWNCGTDPTKTGEPLRACEKCKAIGRKITYCSRECQKKDWKYGSPRPHKQICGKPFPTDEVLKSDPSSSDANTPPLKIPQPDPTFKRSFALEYQITLLHASDEDYVLVRVGNETDDFAIRFNSAGNRDLLNERILFLIMRRRAFTNGDKNAVNVMYWLLSQGVTELGFSPYRLASQFEKEFGFRVNTNFELDGVTPATENEVEWANELLKLLAA